MVFKSFTKWVIEKSVERGARHLDQINPGWDKRIDLGSFSIGTYERCVLGQLHGGYHKGLGVAGLTPREAWRCGFDLSPLARWPNWRIFATRSGFDELNDCWRRLILSRRGQTA
jgi:hypothetical protein